MSASTEAGVQIYSSSVHTHQGFRLEAENQREAEVLKKIAAWLPPYVASIDAGPGNKTRGLKKIVTEDDASEDTLFSLHVVNVTRDKDKKRPADDLR